MSNPDKRRVHVAEIKKTYKGKVHVSTYLRRTFREDGKVKHETVANISDLPDDLLAVIKNRLATGQPLVGDGGTMTIHRSLPHGNVAAVLGTMRNIGLDQFIAARPCRERSLVMAMIADAIIAVIARRSFMACCVIRKGVRSPSKCSPATRQIRKHLRASSGRFASGSALQTWCS